MLLDLLLRELRRREAMTKKTPKGRKRKTAGKRKTMDSRYPPGRARGGPSGPPDDTPEQRDQLAVILQLEQALTTARGDLDFRRVRRMFSRSVKNLPQTKAVRQAVRVLERVLKNVEREEIGVRGAAGGRSATRRRR